jgi:uncharacterized protein YbjQ (UPF0145 family)
LVDWPLKRWTPGDGTITLNTMKTHKKVSGLSGNEIFCLHQIDRTPGQLCIGNSVVSIGVGGGIGAGLSTLGGGEVTEVTRLVHEGRSNSFKRMMDEARENGGVGLTGVTFDLINHGGNLEFITTGSTVHARGGEPQGAMFSTSADAQELYCQIDSGFDPLHFVFGNVAYSIGVGGNIAGAFRALKRGEVTQYSEIFDRTRHLALQRIIEDAKRFGANAVIGIKTTISPLMGAQEMMMVGTASRHPLLQGVSEPITSDMTNEELWNMMNIGYMPVRLVMGVSVYSLGLAGGIGAFFQSLGGGEVSGLTEILYEAREKALERIELEAERYGADEVIGVKTKVYDLGGGLVEFMAIGTAVKRTPGATTKSPSLLAQAIIQDRDTFVDASDVPGASVLEAGRGSTGSSASRMQRGPFAIFFFVAAIIFTILKIFLFAH